MNSENSNSSLSKLLAESLASGEKFNYAKFNKKSTEKGGRGNKLLKFTYSNNDHEGSFEKVCERFGWRFMEVLGYSELLDGHSVVGDI